MAYLVSLFCEAFVHGVAQYLGTWCMKELLAPTEQAESDSTSTEVLSSRSPFTDDDLRQITESYTHTYPLEDHDCDNNS